MAGLKFEKISSIEEVEEAECFDITLLESDVYLNEPNFIANNIVVHNCGMDVTYTRRKKGEEPYSIHPIMRPALEKTHGVLVFQEQVMDILRIVGNIPDMHTEKVRKAISKKKVKDFIKYKDMFLENGQSNLNCNIDYVSNLWDQIESFAEYGFNKSHSYAYSFISARLLYLKAHYPLEFYTAILQCESDTDKFKIYKLDAKYHGIDICPVDINKSGVNFQINDGKIYFGFSNIKGIGTEVAQRIVENQPYKDFTDFLDRFGTDAKVIKPLVALGVFGPDRVKLRKFSKYHQEHAKSVKGVNKRFQNAMLKKDNQLKELLLTKIEESHPQFNKLCSYSDESQKLWSEVFSDTMTEVVSKVKGVEKIKEVPFLTLLNKLANKRDLSIIGNEGKNERESNLKLTLSNCDLSNVELEAEEEEILTNVLPVNGVNSYPMAESLYYGFQWTHILETCPKYTGATIDKFMAEVDGDPTLKTSMIEVEIKSVRKRVSKNNVEFYSIDVEDANGKLMVVNMWRDDYTRFHEDIKTGNLVKMQVNPPGGGFNTLTFKSYPRSERHKLGPKESDARLLIMIPEKVEQNAQDKVLEELKFESSAIQILE